MITWGQRRNPAGVVRVRRTIRARPGERWDAAERAVLCGLKNHDLHDAYRRLHGYRSQAYSWLLNRKGAVVRRRFDHVFSSWDLRPVSCDYLHGWRENELSDPAIEAVLELDR